MLKPRAVVTLVVSILLGGSMVSYGQERLTAEDYIEIQQLYTQYNYAIDAGDVEAYVALYVPDGSFNDFQGHDGLREFMENRDGATRRHWNTNLMITGTPEGAKGSVYLLLVDVGVRPPALSVAGQYEDTLVKTPQGWRFKSRRVRVEGPAQ